jgi:hypothetical protein
MKTINQDHHENQNCENPSIESKTYEDHDNQSR